MPAEGALAAFLINKVASSGWHGFRLPGYRIPGKVEKQQIKKAFTPLVGKAGQKPRVADLVAKLDDAGVVVQDIAQGKELKEVIKSVPKHTKKKLFGGGTRKLRRTHLCAYRRCPRHPCPWLSYGRRPVHRQSRPPVPVQLGKHDGFAVQPLDDRQHLDGHRHEPLPDRNRSRCATAARLIKADDGLAMWKGDREVGQLAAGDYGKIAETMFDRGPTTRAVARCSGASISRASGRP